MKVYIRHIDEARGAFCGEMMTMDQINDLIIDLQYNGIYDENEHHSNINIFHQFINDRQDNSFCVELIWEDRRTGLGNEI